MKPLQSTEANGRTSARRGRSPCRGDRAWCYTDRNGFVYTQAMPRALPFLYAAEELHDALTERLAPVLAEAGLTSAQFSVLYMLIEGGVTTPGGIAEQQRCVKSNVAYLVRPMHREGLIELSSGKADQRTRVIAATKLGQRRYAKGKAGVEKLESTLALALGSRALADVVRACLDTAAALDGLT
jgi:DNA-binding MarR family transcriptional regulator